MSDKSKIEWTDASWNPIRGCSLVSNGCKNCYAMGVAGRFSGPGLTYDGLAVKTSQGYKWTGKIDLAHDALSKPIYWKRPRKIFVNSMSDLFHEDVPEWYIDQIFVTMAMAKQHIYQVLTKRPERMRDYIKAFSWERAVANCVGADGVSVIHKHTMQALRGHFGIEGETNLFKLLSMWPLPNFWLGVSVEDQDAANLRIPILLETPAAIRWLSMEPMIGPVNLDAVYLNQPGIVWVDWVIVGGESGPKARPMHPRWARILRDQCAGAGVPFLFKQWGEWLPDVWAGSLGTASSPLHKFDDGTHSVRIGKKAAGRLLDGVLHDEYPREGK